MILHLIEMTKLMKLKYLYLGYFIKNVDRMNYKVLFHLAKYLKMANGMF